MPKSYWTTVQTPNGLKYFRADEVTDDLMQKIRDEANDVLYAEYGVTSFDDIKAAYDAGKKVCVVRTSSNTTHVYELAAYIDNQSFPNLRMFAFTCLDRGMQLSVNCYPSNWESMADRSFAADADLESLTESVAPYYNMIPCPIAKGTYAMNGHTLYRANTTITSESTYATWDPSQWDRATVGERLGEPGVFNVTVLQTRYDDIEEAYLRGDALVARISGLQFHLSAYDDFAKTFTFVTSNDGYDAIQYTCYKTGHSETNDWDLAGEVRNFVNPLDIASTYSSESTYEVGDLCYNDGGEGWKLYRCTTAIAAPENWTPGHWTETSVNAELQRVESSSKVVVFEVNPVQGIQYPTFNDVRQAAASGKVAVLHVVNYNGSSDSPADYFHLVKYSSAPSYHAYSFSNGKEVKTVDSSNNWGSSSTYDSALDEYSTNAVQNSTLYAVIKDLKDRVAALEGN